ncbi:fungal-specific transcription factor domain-containing protein [Ilyonectria destructans]|nr:fungal-specific transcription factor domain-containing protein [Ilyonectria destructans]
MEEDDGPDQSAYADDISRTPEGGLACNSCRRRKLRCSREAPSCQHCRKTGSECVYEAKRAKPGMKAGAIENLHRRLDTLERSVARQQTSLDCLQAEAEAPRQQPQDPSTRSILSLLATELQKFNATPSSPAQSTPRREQNGASAKRRRLNDDRAYEQRILANGIPHLADERELDEVLKSYFNHVHPWIPIIHEGRFRRRLDDDVERDKLHLVLQSMILVASRYIADEDISNSLLRSAEESENYRDWVVSKAMKHLSVENLQALLIIAFNDIGNGQASQAWPLVGSLTRMAEYLQLTVEHDEAERPSFSQPYKSLSAAKDWTEAEERRRVFWNVFSLDRFCSVSMGWNTSLTSDDVNRRLPCDGITWRKEIPVTTPYFGIWDKSAGRIGNPITFFPTHPVPLQTTGDGEGTTPSEAGTSPEVAGTHVDMSTIGAFAYCIEATESLSRVTSYFLQQKVNIRDQRDLSDWLTRFKELDLRLVHWKMLLPQKWKVNTAQDSPSRMDPNLTLAHVIHNASMILLHQPIAFPPPDWPFKTRLPSLCSIDTCQAAAIEIATITDRYLNRAPSKSLLSSQFSFCVYIAARVLLLHWRNGSVVGLTAEFWLLVESLKAMSKRWAGAYDTQCLQNNLAAKYASFLVELHSRCAQDESFSINVPGYTTEVKHSNTNSQSPVGASTLNQSNGQSAFLAHQSPHDGLNQSSTMLFSNGDAGNSSNAQMSTQQVTFGPQSVATTMAPSPYSVQIAAPMESNNMTDLIQPESYHRGSVGTGDLTAISQMLLDQQFADMDRIISYDDGMFVAEYEGGGW